MMSINTTGVRAWVKEMYRASRRRGYSTLLRFPGHGRLDFAGTQPRSFWI